MTSALPSPGHIATAAALQSLHVQRDRPDRCWWCFRLWPCPDRAWADRVLQLAREVRGDA